MYYTHVTVQSDNDTYISKRADGQFQSLCITSRATWAKFKEIAAFVN